MGVLLAFLTGWVIGAQGGRQGYDDVLAAAKQVLSSEEFKALSVVVRTHGSFTLRQLADWLDHPPASGTAVDDVLARVRRLVQPQPE